jgi:hypothetical protein
VGGGARRVLHLCPFCPFSVFCVCVSDKKMHTLLE